MHDGAVCDGLMPGHQETARAAIRIRAVSDAGEMREPGGAGLEW